MLVHFFVTVLTITSSIATMTADLEQRRRPATWQDGDDALAVQLQLQLGLSREEVSVASAADASKALARSSGVAVVASSSLSSLPTTALEHQRSASSGDAQERGTYEIKSA